MKEKSLLKLDKERLTVKVDVL